MAIAKFKGSQTIGRRKAAKARVFLTDGSGEISVNGLPYDKYFGLESLRRVVRQPLVVAGVEKKFQIKATVNGGGKTGQAGAIKLGIARALIMHDSEMRPVLKKAGHLTRDPRAVERKKYGHHKARRRPQFSKR